MMEISNNLLMIVTKWGSVSVTERNNEPYIEVSGFEVDGGSQVELSLYAIQYAIRALQECLPSLGVNVIKY